MLILSFEFKWWFFLTLLCDLWNDVPTIYLASGAVFSWDMLLSPFRARMNFETKQLRVKTLLENLFNSTYSKIVLSKSMLSKQKVSKYFFFFWGSASSISREGLQPPHSHTAQLTLNWCQSIYSGSSEICKWQVY